MIKIVPKMKIFKILLDEKGIKPTYQRLKILEYISENTKNHPTAEMIYEKLSKDIPTMSLTTVYNTLNSFLEKGLVSPVTITGTEIRYDFNTSSHHHFLCKECGKIIDISVECPFSEGEKSISGHKIEEIHGYFKGICADCLVKMRTKVKDQSSGPYFKNSAKISSSRMEKIKAGKDKIIL